MIPNIFSWQQLAWQRLIMNKYRLPHALLLVGPQGLGKKQFALTFANTLLCHQADATVPCAQCHSCHLFKAQSHPDLLLIEPEKTGQLIKIEQIREGIQFIHETSHQSKLRIIVINPANAMNMNSANALLKSLEEPAPNTLIILISDPSLRLPATIKSRCQKIIFTTPTREVALDWLTMQIPNNNIDLQLLLNLADGAPLKAQEYAVDGVFDLRQTFYQKLTLLTKNQVDPLTLATELQDQDMRLILGLLLTWLQDLLRYKLTKGQSELINYDYQDIFAKVIHAISSEDLINYIDQVKQTYKHLLQALNLNRQLMLEDLFIGWVHYATH